MADSTISGLPQLTVVPTTAVFPCDSGGTTYQATLARMLQSFQQAATTVYWGGSAGVSDVNAINLTIPALSANGISAYFDGLTVGFYTTNSNTGNMTLNVNGIGAVTLRYGTSQISSGDVAASRLIFATYIAANAQWRIAPANGYQYISGAMNALSLLNGLSGSPTDSSATLATTAQLTAREAARPRFAYFRGSTSQTMGTVLMYNTPSNTQVGTGYAPGTGVFTAPVAGMYQFAAGISMTNSFGSAVTRQFTMTFGGTSSGIVPAWSNNIANAATTQLTIASGPVQMAAGDTVSVNASAVLTAAQPLDASGASFFTGAQLW